MDRALTEPSQARNLPQKDFALYKCAQGEAGKGRRGLIAWLFLTDEHPGTLTPSQLCGNYGTTGKNGDKNPHGLIPGLNDDEEFSGVLLNPLVDGLWQDKRQRF